VPDHSPAGAAIGEVPGPVRCLPSRARDAPPSRGAGRHPGAHGAAAVGQPRVARGC